MAAKSRARITVSPAEALAALGCHRRDIGRQITDEIDADPDEVARLRKSRQQARDGNIVYDRHSDEEG